MKLLSVFYFYLFSLIRSYVLKQKVEVQFSFHKLQSHYTNHNYNGINLKQPVNPPIIPFDIHNEIDNSALQEKIKSMVYKARKKQKLNQFIKNYSKLKSPHSTLSSSTSTFLLNNIRNATSSNMITGSMTSINQPTIDSLPYSNSLTITTKSSMGTEVDDDDIDRFFLLRSLIFDELDEFPEHSSMMNNIRRSIMSVVTFVIIFSSICSFSYILFPGSFRNEIFNYNHNMIVNMYDQYIKYQENVETVMMSEPEFSESGGVTFDDFEYPEPKTTVDVIPWKGVRDTDISDGSNGITKVGIIVDEI